MVGCDGYRVYMSIHPSIHVVEYATTMHEVGENSLHALAVLLWWCLRRRASAQRVQDLAQKL